MCSFCNACMQRFMIISRAPVQNGIWHRSGAFALVYSEPDYGRESCPEVSLAWSMNTLTKNTLESRSVTSCCSDDVSGRGATLAYFYDICREAFIEK
ncbi:hypothetical protein AX14_008660 [Amanita brunnescens Koide BX004]|nr:hypothetical protein AX14_008660 [Amanita brunnescens Koide BX004]